MVWQTVREDKRMVIQYKDIPVCAAPGGETDTFEPLGEGVFRWTRHAISSTQQMCMRLMCMEPMRYGMVPAVTYNGNDWGAKLDYIEFTDAQTGKPWRWAYHRASIPGATFSQGDRFSVAMYVAPAQAECACSLYPQNGYAIHEMIWPLQEGPRVFHQKKVWGPPTRAKAATSDTFSVIVVLHTQAEPRFGFTKLLRTAWEQRDNNLAPAFTNEVLWQLGITYAKTLYTREADGFCGFNIGLHWRDGAWRKREETKYEIGWCGQNASLANSMLWEGFKQQDARTMEMGISVLDAWAAHPIGKGLIHTHFDDHPFSQGHPKTVDACNLGTAAVQYVQAHELAKICGYARPQYLEIARAICDFARAQMDDNGCIGKSWRENDLAPAVREGTVGAFLTLALAVCAVRFQYAPYLEAACKSYWHYAQELERQGFTTAGALDIYCVDKESSIPLLKAGIMLYEHTKQDCFLQAACKAAWYLSTWQWHYTRRYPQGSLLAQLGYNTFGGTAVSTTHQHQDPYAVSYILSLLDLSVHTGQECWAERARAVWCNAQQLISDGTLRVDGKLRPAGSQDEGAAYTEWGPVNEPTQWLVAWPTAFRLEVLRTLENESKAKRDFYQRWLS